MVISKNTPYPLPYLKQSSYLTGSFLIEILCKAHELDILTGKGNCRILAKRAGIQVDFEASCGTQIDVVVNEIEERREEELRMSLVVGAQPVGSTPLGHSKMRRDTRLLEEHAMASSC